MDLRRGIKNESEESFNDQDETFTDAFQSAETGLTSSSSQGPRRAPKAARAKKAKQTCSQRQNKHAHGHSHGHEEEEEDEYEEDEEDEEETEKPVQRKRRKQVERACSNCRRSKTACSSERPCKRCVSHNIESTCIDAPRKRRAKKAKLSLEDQFLWHEFSKFVGDPSIIANGLLPTKILSDPALLFDGQSKTNASGALSRPVHLHGESADTNLGTVLRKRQRSSSMASDRTFEQDDPSHPSSSSSSTSSSSPSTPPGTQHNHNHNNHNHNNESEMSPMPPLFGFSPSSSSSFLFGSSGSNGSGSFPCVYKEHDQYLQYLQHQQHQQQQQQQQHQFQHTHEGMDQEPVPEFSHLLSDLWRPLKVPIQNTDFCNGPTASNQQQSNGPSFLSNFSSINSHSNFSNNPVLGGPIVSSAASSSSFNNPFGSNSSRFPSDCFKFSASNSFLSSFTDGPLLSTNDPCGNSPSPSPSNVSHNGGTSHSPAATHTDPTPIVLASAGGQSQTAAVGSPKPTVGLHFGVNEPVAPLPSSRQSFELFFQSLISDSGAPNPGFQPVA